MQVTYIRQDNLHIFEPLMIERAAAAIRSGLEVPAIGIVDEDKREAAGAVVGYLQGGIFMVTSFYVAPAYRRGGGGKLLMDSLKEVLSGRASAIDLSFTSTNEDHQKLILFLESQGFERDENCAETFRLTVGKARESKFLGAGETDYGVLLRDAPQNVLLAAWNKAVERGVAIGMDRIDLEPDVSVLHISNNQIDSFVAFRYNAKSGLYLIAAHNGTGNPKALVYLLQRALTEITAKYPPDTEVFVNAMDDTVKKIVLSMVKDAESISRRYLYKI